MQEPEYMIMNDGAGFALYRKLFPGEYFWYRNELHRLRKYENELWLRLDWNDNKGELEAKIDNMKKIIFSFNVYN